MKNITKIIALMLAALMLMSSFAFAATDSKEDPGKRKKEGTKAGYTCYSDKSATVTGVTKAEQKKTTKTIKKTVKMNGKTYTTTVIAKNSLSKLKKVKVIKVYATKALTVQKGAFGKLNTKKITIKVTKKMSSKEFKKFKKNLKKAGFKGKIKRVKL